MNEGGGGRRSFNLISVLVVNTYLGMMDFVHQVSRDKAIFYQKEFQCHLA